MKKILLILIFTVSFLVLHSFSSYADSIGYAFDSITITKAFKFEVECLESPNEESFLYSNVFPGETFTVYIGELRYMHNGEETYGSDSIIIITNANGIDIIRWLVNGKSYTYPQDNDDDTIILYDFSSHILIDPNYGIVKTDDLLALRTLVRITNDMYELIDNTSKTYSMIPGSLEVLEDVNIVISLNNQEELG